MSRRPGEKEPLKEVPLYVVDKTRGKKYIKGRFLGKGGFARCYELTECRTNTVVAGKVVSKSLLLKPYQKDKIQIHRHLNHPHVVKLITNFEDEDNVYILLELCARRSLMELHKRRKGVTEPEARYFTYQVADAVEYIHAQKIIHRDLKLGNLFLNDDLQVKIGDFGLAATVDVEGERKKTLCGTPNYIAPEVLNKAGHSYEVDIWAIGCILYTLIVGKPPFETKHLKETYDRIKANHYRIPCWVGGDARKLIASLLSRNPADRPTTENVRKDAFFKGYMPSRLPTSCLTMAPKFTIEQAPPGEKCNCCTHPNPSAYLSPVVRGAMRPKKEEETAMVRTLQPLVENVKRNEEGKTVETHTDHHHGRVSTNTVASRVQAHLADLSSQLSAVINAYKLDRRLGVEDICEAPEAMPVFWVSKWVDYSDKYGIGYQLCDNSVGVLYNDSTKIVLDNAGKQMFYIDRDGNEEYFTIDAFPDELSKKATLLNYFRAYMNDHLLKAGENAAPKEGDELARLPYLRNWFRTKSAIVLHLSNGTLQLNFHETHEKLVVCPLMGAASFIDKEQNVRVLKLSLMAKHGCPKDLFDKLKYAKAMTDRLLSSFGRHSKPGSLSTGDAPPPILHSRMAISAV